MKGEDYDIAAESYQQDLTSAQASQNACREVNALLNFGEFYLENADYEQAAIHFGYALELARVLQHPQQEGIALAGLGRVSQQRGNLAKAIDYYKQCINIAESIRATLKIEEKAESFANLWANSYEELIAMLWQKNDFSEAFTYVERARSRAFLDQLANGRIDFRRAAEPELLEEEKTLKTRIIDLRKELTILHQPPQNLWKKDAIEEVEKKLNALEKDYDNLLTQLKKQSPETASLISVDVEPLDKVQKLLDAETTLVEYFVRDEQTLVFIINRDRFNAVPLNVTRKELNDELTLFRDFSDTIDPYPIELKNLFAWLIEPLKVKGYLNTCKLAIVPHNILHYIPFAALTNGEHYLIDDYALVTLPCASVLRFLPNKCTSVAKTLLALGAPANTLKSLPPLNCAQKEVEAIARLFDTNAFVGKDATESLVWFQSKNAGIVHIAAHGEYNSNNPLLSTIHLARDDRAEVDQKDGRLEVYDVYRLDLTAANLVVLSACQTHIGNTQKVSPSDEVIGLNRAFIYAGTPTVIASLWNVDDAATGLLMERFYTHLKEGMGKADALQQAQIEVQKDYPHPCFWAAFVLTGDGGKL
jgi:CHAT domain-containing protein